MCLGAIDLTLSDALLLIPNPSVSCLQGRKAITRGPAPPDSLIAAGTSANVRPRACHVCLRRILTSAADPHIRRRLVSYTAPQDRGGAEAAKAVANALNKVALGAPLRAASRNRYAPYSTLRSVWVEMGGYDESDA